MTKKNDDQIVNSQNQPAGQTVSMEEFETLQTEFSNLQVQYELITGQYKRALADYQNLEKRVSESRAEMATWATNNLIEKLLPSLDYLEQALQGAGEIESKSGWFKGVEMAVRALTDTLKDEGLEQIGADGQFDPTLHEAVDTRVGEEGKIIEVTRKGYILNGKVLRPALVIVGRKES